MSHNSPSTPSFLTQTPSTQPRTVIRTFSLARRIRAGCVSTSTGSTTDAAPFVATTLPYTETKATLELGTTLITNLDFDATACTTQNGVAADLRAIATRRSM
jgi:hypothetical protein